MNWTEIKQDEYRPIACLDGIGNVHHLMFSPSPVEKKETDENPNPPDTRVVFVRTETEPSFEDVYNYLVNIIKEYDKSNEINHFIYNNYHYWFSKDERVALKYKFEVLLNKGESTGLVWFGSKPYEVNVVEMLDFIEDLEYYAIQCNDVTRTHLNEIKVINNTEELLRYNITKDYPTSIVMNNNVFKH